MKFLVLAALPALVAAQGYGAPPASSPSSSAASSSAAPAVPTAGPGQHIVQVGDGGVVFNPSTVTANENDTVTFFFTTTGTVMHSVTQSNFSNPCELAPGGFDSGLQPNGATYTIRITNASQPIWFYCQQTSPAKHCNLGMVGGINVPSSGDHDISAFMAAASTASDPTETASGVLSGIGAVATAPAAVSSAAPAASSSSSNGAMRLVAGAGSLLAGLFAAVYTLA